MNRFLSFITEGFGGHGGIALYNRDLLQALCSHPDMVGGVVLPRHMSNLHEPIPVKLTYLRAATGGKIRYLIAAAKLLLLDRNFNLVLCGHINLLPLAWLASRLLDVPLVLVIFGIDAWQPTKNRLANRLAHKADWVVSISEVTAQKFRAWCRGGTQRLLILPNAIHTEWYSPGPKKPELLHRYGLNGKAVLMTLGRLESDERYKGFDEVIDLLPALAVTKPNLAYLVVGDGSDRPRLEAKVCALGLSDRVMFAGLVPEIEKADHYRLADAYVMASRGEGFGFVLLEAMACGVPVVASKLDGGREAVRDGQLGMLVDPGDADGLKRAILETLERPAGVVPEGLAYFAFPHFETRVHGLIGQVLPDPARPDLEHTLGGP